MNTEQKPFERYKWNPKGEQSIENRKDGVIKEGLELAQQMSALPFKAVRQIVDTAGLGERPIADIIRETITLGEGLARLPFRTATALLAELQADPNRTSSD